MLDYDGGSRVLLLDTERLNKDQQNCCVVCLGVINSVTKQGINW